MSPRTLLSLVLLVLIGLGALLVLLQEPETPGDLVPSTTRSTEDPPAHELPSLPDPGAALVSESGAEREILPLTPSGTTITRVLGRIVAGAAEPVVGARVSVLELPANAFDGPPHFLETTARSGADGGFVLIGLPSGVPLAVLVEAPGYAPEQRDGLRLGVGETRDLGSFRLGSGLALVGTVQNELGAPVGGARVTVVDTERRDSGTEGALGALAGTADTDAEGRYSVPHLGRRQYEIRAEAEGHAGVSTQLTFVLGRDMHEWTHDLVLETANVPLAGVVLGPDEQGVSGALVKLSRRPDLRTTSFFRAETSSDADGQFRFAALPDGRFDVSIEAGSWYLPGFKQIDSNREDHVLRVQPAIVIHGELVSESLPVPSVFTVRVRPQAATGAGTLPGALSEREFDVPDAPGRFDFDGLKPGAYTFDVRAEGFAPTSGTQVKVGVSQLEASVVIPLRAGGSVSGRVVPPTVGTRIEVRTGDWDPASPIEGTFPTPPRHVATLDPEGNFRVEHVPAGLYVVSARPPSGPAAHLRDVQVEEALDTALGELRLGASGGLRGVVIEPDGRPARNARVAIQPETGAFVQVTTDSEGRWEALGLPVGPVNISATPAGLWEALKYECRAEAEVVAGEVREIVLRLVTRESMLENAAPLPDAAGNPFDQR